MSSLATNGGFIMEISEAAKGPNYQKYLAMRKSKHRRACAQSWKLRLKLKAAETVVHIFIACLLQNQICWGFFTNLEVSVKEGVSHWEVTYAWAVRLHSVHMRAVFNYKCPICRSKTWGETYTRVNWKPPFYCNKLGMRGAKRLEHLCLFYYRIVQYCVTDISYGCFR